MRCKECKRRYKKGKKQVDANTAVVNGDSGGGGVRKLTGSGNKPEKRRSGGGGGKKVSFKKRNEIRKKQ